ncbi:MAG: RNA methyltransferase [Pseudomonadota bacterium]
MTRSPLLENFVIVLNHPMIPENIGAAARAASNMGIGGLIVVNPENLDPERILKMATHKAAYLIKRMKVFADLKEALSGFTYIVGTTARTGRGRRPVLTPREVATSLIQIAPQNQIALVFGSEDKGLTNQEIRLCHQLVKIPTAKFSSLNLAQAVMIMSYEIFLARIGPFEKVCPPLATSQELELMYERVKEILVKISFIQPENPDHWMMNVRRFFSRIGLQANEVSLIMGICRQIDWFGKSRTS